MKKALFLRRKVNRKSNFSSVCRGLPQQREEKYFISRCDESIYTIPHSLFMQKKVLFMHLLKKLLCVTREQLTFSDSDDDFEHSCITREPEHSGLERRKSDINLGFTEISNKKLFYIIAFESLSNLL